ncbi:hypothetical protein XM38_025130 [Halomicronema hongdechloris C2206]|uniref:Sulfotransferase domain-containing protein n=2 Tax=Halomicronema hongdechloris TaxID=1209493 RepID=A0A1Z3HMN0_9CYAN|nr:hypothetical protein XM38_025130 [Halomicronema hongdechloris C2206]
MGVLTTMTPDFLFIGASKCATTTITALLNQHPDIFTPPHEVSFFARDDLYAKGIDWYRSLFTAAQLGQIKGENSNIYTMQEIYPQAVERIRAYSTDLKLIYCVRDPFTRIESYWLEIRSHGGEVVHHDFNTAIKLNRDWLIDASNYWQQINAYRPYFSNEQILIIFFEDFKTNPHRVLRTCFEFLGVDPEISIDTTLQMNPSATKTMPSPVLSKLRANPLYRASVQVLPRDLRDPLKKRLFFKPVSERPQWQPETQQWVLEQLADDTQALLNYCGKPLDYWSSFSQPAYSPIQHL